MIRHMVNRNAKNSGSIPMVAAMGIIMGKLTMMMATVSIKHPIITVMPSITIKMPVGSNGNDCIRFPTKRFAPVLPAKELNAEPAMASHMTIALIRNAFNTARFKR